MMFKNILTSGYTFDNDEHELKLKYILFNSLLLFNITMVTIASLIRFINEQLLQGFIDVVYIAFGIFTFFLARHSKVYFSKLIYFVVFFSYLIVTLTFYSGLNQLTGVSWYIILIMTAFYLQGKKDGTTVFIISLITIVGINIVQHNYTYVQTALGFIPFLAALFFMYFFEARNKNFKRQLLEANSTLKEHNIELSYIVKTSKLQILKLQQILEKSPVSIIITDRDGNIEYANPWFSKITGYSLEEAIGKNPRVLKSDLYSDKEYSQLWSDITHKKVWNGTFKNITKDGKEYWESAMVAPVNDEQGELAHYIAIKQEITQQVYLQERLNQSNREKVENFEKTLESFVSMVEQRDTYTAGHSERVAKYSRLIATEMNYSEEDCELIHRAAILHDIGKIATPDNILLKPKGLTELEYSLIQEHVETSYKILSSIPMYKDLADIIVHHHERYDGKGYPHGYKKDEIPP
ncbi:MAG: PAS domain S-box protein, partial [Campylobacterota bacterium]|nr:PAS domain S-box protein [Campylobacterota bacterium]